MAKTSNKPKAASEKKPATKKTTTKASADKPAKKATTKKAADPVANLAQKCQEAATKLEKMEGQQYQEVKEKIEWCLGSYNYDKNPEGLKEYGQKAADVLKEARQEKPRQVSQKLIDDLEKAVSQV